MPQYSDTTHGRFIEHMDLARAWIGPRWSDGCLSRIETRLSRIMNRYDTPTLKRMLTGRGVKVE